MRGNDQVSHENDRRRPTNPPRSTLPRLRVAHVTTSTPSSITHIYRRATARTRDEG
ncbi:hypothetical protein GALMADRAFT_255684 [Galerina marginata CBS 339.88]|uniref:Uncharacterized protein n=1 Tax=Galerina marginata (strain CBS 339.88) TaxID=685588 RepID=A0A067SQ80_GALM3|nr:hypothetical protein GALMADRAFT_255684 [Galerina marginata CBS 339.88]